MKGSIALSALIIAAVAGCSEAPDPPTTEETAPPQGVFGLAPPAVRGLTSVITLATPTPAEVATDRQTPTIDQLGLAFAPTELLVGVGESVAFTNSESIGHNVHVQSADSDSTVVNRDTDPAQRIEVAFDTEGAYVVGCDVHPGMRALIYVTPASFGAFADEEGNFLVPDVPPGTYTLSVWSADPGLRSERTIEVSGPSTEVSLGSQ